MFCGVLWCSVVFRSILWCPVMFCGIPWYSVVFLVFCGVQWSCGVLWCSVIFCDVCGVLWCRVSCGVLWCSVVFRGSCSCHSAGWGWRAAECCGCLSLIQQLWGERDRLKWRQPTFWVGEQLEWTSLLGNVRTSMSKVLREKPHVFYRSLSGEESWAEMCEEDTGGWQSPDLLCLPKNRSHMLSYGGPALYSSRLCFISDMGTGRFVPSAFSNLTQNFRGDSTTSLEVEKWNILCFCQLILLLFSCLFIVILYSHLDGAQ